MPTRRHCLLIAAVLLGSWFAMQGVHELGHVAAARWTGGIVARVVFNPFEISHTDLAHNPRPLVVAWAGPACGVLLPLVVWSLAAALRLPGAFVLRFFAGFCLVANGAYLLGGSFARIGDCGELLRHGMPMWRLWIFGAVTIPAGLWLWHGEGPHFGLNKWPT